jgi:hypothetical protein
VPTSSFGPSLRIPSTSLPIEPPAVPQFQPYKLSCFTSTRTKREEKGIASAQRPFRGSVNLQRGSRPSCLTKSGKAVSVPTSSFGPSLRIPSTSLPIEPPAPRDETSRGAPAYEDQSQHEKTKKFRNRGGPDSMMLRGRTQHLLLIVDAFNRSFSLLESGPPRFLNL